MRITDMNWMQVEAYLQQDDRAVLPTGSTEQHGYLSLSVDSLLCERSAIEAAEPLGIPVFPTVSYGVTPYFAAFPGSVSLRVETYLRVIRDILDNLAHSGFRRILIVNGHGGNVAAQSYLTEWMADHPGLQVKYHNWWNAPLTQAKQDTFDPLASHASWMENYPWTRLADVVLPKDQKSLLDAAQYRMLGPQAFREKLGDGNFGGYYQRPDDEMLAIWQVGVEETRAQLSDGWA